MNDAIAWKLTNADVVVWFVIIDNWVFTLVSKVSSMRAYVAQRSDLGDACHWAVMATEAEEKHNGHSMSGDVLHVTTDTDPRELAGIINRDVAAEGAFALTGLVERIWKTGVVLA